MKTHSTWLSRFWRRRVGGYKRWLVFTKDKTVVVDGKEPPPRFEGETARVEVYW